MEKLEWDLRANRQLAERCGRCSRIARTVGDGESLQLKGPGSMKLHKIDQLVDQGLVICSPQWTDWVRALSRPGRRTDGSDPEL